MTEKWKIFEVELDGTAEGNPFQDIWLTAVFKHSGKEKKVQGFYCENGKYKIRFMPDETGKWTAVTESNDRKLDGVHLECYCVQPKQQNHGRVLRKDTIIERPAEEDKYHLAYEDGSTYKPFGTTCYAWIHQSQEIQEQTLQTLKNSPFNKVRMCIFPKYYTYNTQDPEEYPFKVNTSGGFDLTRFNERYWNNLEHRIRQLDELGIQADIILMHPYDRWGFANMGRDTDIFYLKYAVARLCHYKNIWWSLANEYDLMTEKSEKDWEEYAQTVRDTDPYGHLCSIHNCLKFYDFTRTWITHCSIQRIDVYKTAESVTEWRETYEKPIVVDECAYEGNINYGWGNITGEEMTRRFWEGCIRGGYLSHGETYVDRGEQIWWSHGGTLSGTSPARIRFLKKIIEEAPEGAVPLKVTAENHEANWDVPCLHCGDDYFLYYFGFFRPSFRTYELPPEKEYTIELIDTWNMTIQKLEGTWKGNIRIEMPSREYMAVRVVRNQERSSEK